jgi:DNA-directed RNA polymerase subunit H (RpoH/RPB5)
MNIELNTKEINNIVIKNILIMLYRRHLLDDYEQVFNSISNEINNKSTIEFILNNNTKCSIYNVNGKLISITQKSPLDEYLSTNHNVHKIVIFKDLSKKIAKQINEEYKNSEFFFEHEMLEDIINKSFIPTHQLLISEEKEELLSKFAENELSIIFTTDMMSRYFNAQIGDIFRIIRPSITSGKSIFYRRVVHGSWDKIFS